MRADPDIAALIRAMMRIYPAGKVRPASCISRSKMKIPPWQGF